MWNRSTKEMGIAVIVEGYEDREGLPTVGAPQEEHLRKENHRDISISRRRQHLTPNRCIEWYGGYSASYYHLPIPSLSLRSTLLLPSSSFLSILLLRSRFLVRINRRLWTFGVTLTQSKMQPVYGAQKIQNQINPVSQNSFEVTLCRVISLFDGETRRANARIKGFLILPN